MRRTSLLFVLGLAACGGSGKPAAAPPTPPTDAAVVEDEPEPDAGEDDGLELVSDRGRIDPDVATAKVAPHAAALDACYSEQLGRRRWLGGSVELTWAVAADGALTSVHVARSDLGAWPIEKCLLDVAAGVAFGKPQGRGKAEVTFPLAFSGGSAAMPWDDTQAARAVGGKPSELAACAKAGGGDPANVTITIYVGTRGKVQSVGFAAPTPLAPAWADCAAAKVSAWTLTDPRGKVAKLAYLYHPMATADDDSED